jgi:glycosidase
MIYYGTEAGMWGANDPCDRQPMLWPDVRHESETHTINGRCPPRVRKPDEGLFDFFRQMIALRKKHVALRRGELRWLQTGDERLLAFERAGDGERIVAAFNASDRPLGFKMKNPARDLKTGGGIVKPGRVVVNPRGWSLLLLLNHHSKTVGNHAASPPVRETGR